MKKILKVEGMMCEGCVNRIKNALENIKGVKIIEISLDEKNVHIDVDNEIIFNDVVNKINDLGFEVE